MANDFKMFYNDDLPDSAASPLFTPTGDSIIKDVSIVNHGGSTETVELFIGGSANAKLWKQVELLAGESGEFSGTKIVPASAEVYGRTTNASSVAVMISGLEQV